MNGDNNATGWRYVGLFEPRPKATGKTFIAATSDHFCLPAKELLSKSRRVDLARARHMMRAWLKEHTGLSLKGIARATGNCHHSTVLSSLEVHKGYMYVDKPYRRAYEAYCTAMEGIVP